jgi:ubiquinone/menaquinone biosynthesis C-methylase UbiE
MIENNKAFTSKQIVEFYSQNTYINKPELALLSKYEDKLPKMRMLDIGVGGGRTTFYFGKLAMEYIGTDYSLPMINFCKKRFEIEPNMSFQLCDVRDMQIFPKNYFDFVLFSLNGIDAISHEDRIIALKEIKRVCKSGALFSFSSHNILYIKTAFSFKITSCLRTLLTRIYRYVLIRLKNFDVDLSEKQDYIVICDGAHNFRFKSYYIHPVKQIQQLESIGFKNIKVYTYTEGLEIKDKKLLNNLTDDPMLYYICEAQ